MTAWDTGINLILEDVSQALRGAKLAGARYIEVGGHIHDRGEEETAKLLKLLPASGLTVHSAHQPNCFLDRDPSSFEATIKRNIGYVEWARRVGAKVLVIHPGSVSGDGNYTDLVREVGPKKFDEMNATVMRQMCRHARPYGLDIALENLTPGPVFGWCTTADDILRIRDMVNEDNLKFCLDSGHAHLSSQNPREMITRLRGLLVNTHLNDNFGACQDACAAERVDDDQHRPPGIGTIDWFAVLDGFREVEYEGPIMFELQTRPEDEGDDLFNMTRENWGKILALWRRVRNEPRSKS